MSCAITMLFLAVVCIAGAVAMFANSNKFVAENLTSSQIMLTSVSQKESYILLTTAQTQYVIVPVVAKEIGSDVLQSLENSTVTIYNIDSEVFGIEQNGNVILNAQKMIALRHDIMHNVGIFFVVFGSVMLVLGVVPLILALKMPKQTQQDVITNFYNLDFATDTRKKYNLSYASFALALIFLPFLIAEGNSNGESTKFFVLLWCMLGYIFVCAVVIWVLKPLVRKKDVQFADELYDLEKFITGKEENFAIDMQNDMVYIMQEDGFLCDFDKVLEIEQRYFQAMAEAEYADKFKQQEYVAELTKQYRQALEQKWSTPFLPYCDLNLYIRVVCRPSGIASAFIFSKLSENNKFNLTKDIVLELNPITYHFLKRTNAHINGLDNFMQNRKQIMLKNGKFRNKVVDLVD